jgi:hypothetical protein
MKVDSHIISGSVVAGIVGYFHSFYGAAFVWAGSALLDIDHYLWYALRFQDWSIRRANAFYVAKKADLYYCLCVFHTLEFIVLCIAGLWMSGPVFWLACGALFHIALDVIQSMWDKGLSKRKWSLILGIVHYFNHRAGEKISLK